MMHHFETEPRLTSFSSLYLFIYFLSNHKAIQSGLECSAFLEGMANEQF